MSDKLKSALMTASVPITLTLLAFGYLHVDNFLVFLGIITLTVFFFWSTYQFFVETYDLSIGVLEKRRNQRRYSELSDKGYRERTEEEQYEYENLQSWLQRQEQKSSAFANYAISFLWCAFNMSILVLIKYLYLNQL